VAQHPEWGGDWPEGPFYQWNGADQFSVYGDRYQYLSWIVLAFMLGFLAFDFWRGTKPTAAQRDGRLLLVEFYAISFCAMALFPQNLRLDPDGSWIGSIVARLTLVSAIFALALLGGIHPRAWHAGIFAVCGAVYFGFLYQDTRQLARFEENAETITQGLPFGTRVISTVDAPPGYRPMFMHMIDRACIGHCFMVSNYEPATAKFRVRVSGQGSPVAAAKVDATEAMGSGEYEVQPADLPLKEIYQCDEADPARLCIRELRIGKMNADTGEEP
jgi:hypothetical protein